MAKKTDSIIAKSDWYQANKSVKSEFKAYALGLLNSYVTNKNKFIDFGQIWNLQDVPETFVKIIEKSILKANNYTNKDGKKYSNLELTVFKVSPINNNYEAPKGKFDR